MAESQQRAVDEMRELFHQMLDDLSDEQYSSDQHDERVTLNGSVFYDDDFEEVCP